MSERKGCFRTPLFHIPHDGIIFHTKYFFHDHADIVRGYHKKMTDLHVSELMPSGYRFVKCRFSRLICDVERRMGPEEPMEKYGMGYCYTKVYDGTVIRDEEWACSRTNMYYFSHHDHMNSLCREYSRILLIDLHSYHDEIVPPDFRLAGKELPDLCIGTDPRFTPPELVECVRRKFEAAGFTTEMNYPYSGFYVPESVEDGSSGCDLIGIMLEFHRRTYLDGEEVNPVKAERIRGIIREIVEDWKER